MKCKKHPLLIHFFDQCLSIYCQKSFYQGFSNDTYKGNEEIVIQGAPCNYQLNGSPKGMFTKLSYFSKLANEQKTPIKLIPLSFRNTVKVSYISHQIKLIPTVSNMFLFMAFYLICLSDIMTPLYQTNFCLPLVFNVQ